MFRPFEQRAVNKDQTTVRSHGRGKRERERQREVKTKCFILGSLSPAAWGHLRDRRLNYPPALDARRIRQTRGEDTGS